MLLVYNTTWQEFITSIHKVTIEIIIISHLDGHNINGLLTGMCACTYLIGHCIAGWWIVFCAKRFCAFVPESLPDVSLKWSSRWLHPHYYVIVLKRIPSSTFALHLNCCQLFCFVLCSREMNLHLRIWRENRKVGVVGLTSFSRWF